MDHEIQYIKHIKEYFKNIDVIIEDLNDYPAHIPDIFEKRKDKEKIQWQEVAWQYDDTLNEESQIRECLYPAMFTLKHLKFTCACPIFTHFKDTCLHSTPFECTAWKVCDRL